VKKETRLDVDSSDGRKGNFHATLRHPQPCVSLEAEAELNSFPATLSALV
jgi:hypothetical protein